MILWLANQWYFRLLNMNIEDVNIYDLVPNQIIALIKKLQTALNFV